MIKIVVGGQLSKKENADLIEANGEGKVEIKVMGDLEGAMAIQKGEADFYFGSCQTGAGGALAMAIALNGMAKCLSVAGVGRRVSDEEMADAVDNGVVCFGFVPEAGHSVVPVLMQAILAKQG